MSMPASRRSRRSVMSRLVLPTYALLCIVSAVPAAHAIDFEEIVFPADAGVVDVTAPPYGADPAPGNDDTAAIQQALDDHPGGLVVLYLPNGTYDLVPPEGENSALEFAGKFGGTILQGQSRDGVVLRLADSVDPGYDGAVIRTVADDEWSGQISADIFFNSIRNLTVSVGVGHPLAKGIDFWSNNQGVVRDVTILSEDSELGGAIGLDLGFDDNIGPLFVKRVRVVGFDFGIRTRWQTASQTMEHIELFDQRVAAWENSTSQTVFVRGLETRGEVPAFSSFGQARAVLVDARLEGLGAAVDEPAIETSRFLYLRNVLTSGFAEGLSRRNAPGQEFKFNPAQPDGCIEEYWYEGSSAGSDFRGGGLQLFPSPDRGLGLPVEETPEVLWEPNLDRWDGPHRHVLGTSGIPDDGLDDTASIQAAIDSGATTVYLPNGTWDLHGTVVLRGSVLRLLGTHARLDGPGTVQLGDGASPIVVVERLNKTLGNIAPVTFEHASNRTLVLRHYSGVGYRPGVEEPGDLFLEDVVLSRGAVFSTQNVWGRQVNVEVDTEDDPELEAKLVNDGATVWLLGVKTENKGTVVRTIGGGRTELLGTYHNGPGQSNEEHPRFEVVDASFSGAVFQSATAAGSWDLFARETREGETLEVAEAAGDLYSGFPSDELAGREVAVDESDPDRVTLNGAWTPSQEFDGGWLGLEFLFAAADSGATATYSADLESGSYTVYLRGKSQRGGQPANPHSSNTPVEIAHADGIAAVSVDQSGGGGAWIELGSFDFETETPAVVTIRSDGADGNVLADTVRFVRDGGLRRVDELVLGSGRALVPNDGSDPGVGGSGLRLISGGGVLAPGGAPDASVWTVRNSADIEQQVVLAARPGVLFRLDLPPMTDTVVRSPVATGSAEHFLFQGEQVIDRETRELRLFEDERLVAPGLCLP